MTGFDLIRANERHVIADHRGLELAGARCQVTFGAHASRTLAWCHNVRTPLDVVDVAIASGRPVEAIAAVYREVGEALQLAWLQQQVA